MAIPDISVLTLDELEELIAQANLAHKQGQATQTATIEDRKAIVNAAIADLTTLLGVEGSTPNLTSIRGVLGYTDAQMANNAGLAFRLAFKGLEQLTETVLDLAYVVSRR